ncbi:MAG: hypothetical protein U9M98_00925 [Patescibacteria group bacterium]|nr:hypothetical protein [Patescibacteria group bacterium]
MKKALQTAWEKKGCSIVSELEELYETKIRLNKIKVYLTTFPIIPYHYNKGWLMVNYFAPLEGQIDNIEHELNHFFFHQKFAAKKDKHGHDLFHEIKEAFTALTQPESRGYPINKKLREELKENLKKGKSAEELFELSIKYKDKKR